MVGRYYFHLNECGRTLADSEGRDLPDDADLRGIAIHEARAIMQAEIGDGRLCLSCAIEICDEDGCLISRVEFRDAVAVSGAIGCEASD